MSTDTRIVPGFSRISPMVDIYWTEIIANSKVAALALLQVPLSYSSHPLYDE